MNSPLNNNDSQALLNQIVLEYMQDKRRKRIWSWVKRIILIVIVFVVLYLIFYIKMEDRASNNSPHIGLIDIKGEIFDAHTSSAENFSKGLANAYASKQLKAVILRIDSPGGSPVQADYIYNTIQYYRAKFPSIKIYAVCVETCASAAYYVASAADEIYANPASLVGSIGVIYNGFGFVDSLHKIGATRRLMTAGSNKGFMDPFSPVDAKQEQFMQTMLNEIHQQFIDKVKKGRGSRLHITDNIFSGLVWTGSQAKQLGLIDGLGSSGQLAREKIKIQNVVDYTYQPSVMEQFAKNIGTSMVNELPKTLGLRSGFQ